MEEDRHRNQPDSGVLKALCNNIKQIDDPAVRMRASDFCDALDECISRNGAMALPNLYFSSDEGDAFFEWIFGSFRFGFLFCGRPEESGWYLITKAGGKTERFRGRFEGRETMEYVFDYIGANA